MATKLAKKLPKRVGNEKAKARRKASWEKGQERKRVRRELNAARFETNNRKLSVRGIDPKKLNRTERKTLLMVIRVSEKALSE